MATTPTQTTPTRTTHSAAPLLRAIAPVEAEQFVAEHWEAKPLVVPRAEEGRFDDLLSVRDVERLITETALRTPGFRLVKAGATVTSYTIDLSWRPEPFSGVADVPRVLAEFESGATIVLQGLHHSWLPLARYCRGLEAFLGHPAQANAYFTPRGSQGLPVHHDTHEVFSLQIAGETVLDVTLRAGDTLYLPRGWLHQALTSSSDSLHVTVGVNVRRWIDEARSLLDEAADDVELRRSIDDGEPPELPSLDAATTERRARERFVRTRRPILDGQLSELRALDSLSVETELVRRETVIADLDGTTLVFEGKTLRFPERLAPELEFLVSTEEPFRAAQLPGSLDDPGRLVLVRRLVREGFLRRTAAAA
jgi:lysine-specific demethylase/histidyl-hydroxylase NO66